MKKAIFLSAAEDEMIQSAIFYEKQVPGLGSDFLASVDSAVRSIRENPELWPILRKNIRRRLVSRFPFGILFANEKEGIRIIAVMHLGRDPEYWHQRI